MMSRGLFTGILTVALTIAIFCVDHGIVRGQSGEGASQTRALSGTAHGKLPRQLSQIPLRGWALMETAKRFTPATLWEQIDGRAEFFLSYDMVQMIFAVYTDPSRKMFIDVAIYEMGTPANAFGVFSAERRKEITPNDLGRAGYRSGSNLFIWKGASYVRMIASDDTPGIREVVMRLGKSVTAAIDDSGESVWGLDALPKAGRIPGSEQYFRRDAMGLDFMENTYMARYRQGERFVTLFLSKKETSASASDVLRRHGTYAKQFGEDFTQITRSGVVITLCDMAGAYDALFQKEDMVAGVTGVSDRELAIDSALELWRHLDGK